MPLQRTFGVENSLIVAHRLYSLEAELLGDGFYILIQQNAVVVYNQQMVDQALQVAHLVGGDDDAPIFVGNGGHNPSELSLGGNIESVGRLVEQKQPGVCGNAESDHLLFSSLRTRVRAGYSQG